MRTSEFQALQDDPQVQALQERYANKAVPFNPALEWAIKEATKGIRNPLARDIISDVVLHLVDYLTDVVEQRLPPAKTRVGRWIRVFISLF